MYIKAFLQQFTQPGFWHAQASELLEAIEAALLSEQAPLAKTALNDLDEYIGAPPLLSHADALLILQALKAKIKPAMQVIVSEYIKSMKSASHEFAAQALPESKERHDQVMGYFLENLCSLTLNSAHLPAQTRIDLMSVLPLSYLRNQTVYQHCIALLERNHATDLAQFLSNQKHQAVIIELPAAEPAPSPKRSNIFSALKAINPSKLIKAFIFFRQFMSVAAQSLDEDDNKKLNEWANSLPGNANIYYQDSHTELADNMRAMLVQTREAGVPLIVYELHDKAHPERSKPWNFDDLADSDNQERIDDIYTRGFMDFIKRRLETDWMTYTQRVIFKAFIEELKYNIEKNPDYLADANIPPKMLAQLCLLEAWDQHINEENGRPIEKNKFMHAVDVEIFGESLEGLAFIQEGDHDIAANLLYAFHLPNDHAYGVKLSEQFYYNHLTVTAKGQSHRAVLEVLDKHEKEFLSAPDKKRKFGKINICVALAQAMLECDPPAAIRSIVAEQLPHYIEFHKSLQQDFSDDETHLNLARVVRTGYKNAAVRFIHDNPPTYSQQALSWIQYGLTLTVYATTFTASLLTGYTASRARLRPLRHRLRIAPLPQPAPAGGPARRQPTPVSAPQPQVTAQAGDSSPALFVPVYQQSDTKREHGLIGARCKQLLDESDKLAVQLYKANKTKIVHDFYLEGFLSKEDNMQERLFNSRINALKTEHIKSQHANRDSGSSDEETLTLFESIDAVIKTPERDCLYGVCIKHLANIAKHSEKHMRNKTLPFEKALLEIQDKRDRTDPEIIETAFKAIHGLGEANRFIKLLGKKGAPRQGNRA